MIRRLLRAPSLALFALALAPAGAALAQQPGPVPAPTRALPPQGDWAEVISVTSKWVVLQNADGQQFPVSLTPSNIGLFVMRWPTSPERLTPRAIIEVLGLDLGANNQIEAAHADVFEDDARGLLGNNWPSIVRLSGRNNTVVSPYQFLTNDPYRGYDLLEAITSNPRIPDRLHIVAPVAGIGPLRLGVAGNNLITVVPTAGGLYMTQVTKGVPSWIKPGDLAYYLPLQATPRTLALSQLVVYKTVPVERFNP